MNQEIKLLDGKTYDTLDLLERMANDQFYYGELSRLALSSSALKLLNESPKKYKWSLKGFKEESAALDAGWLFHTAILEPHVFESQIFVDVQSKNTKAYKDALVKHGKAFTVKQKSEAERLADHFFRNENALKQMSNANFEVAGIKAIKARSGKEYAFRGKADILGENRICDLKTTQSVTEFPYSAYKYGYDVQVYIYSEIFNIPHTEFTFCCIEKGNLDIAIWKVSDDNPHSVWRGMTMHEHGKMRALNAIDIYEQFFVNNEDLDNWTVFGNLWDMKKKKLTTDQRLKKLEKTVFEILMYLTNKDKVKSEEEWH